MEPSQSVLCEIYRTRSLASFVLKKLLTAFLISLGILIVPGLIDAQTNRLVILKLDGLPHDTVDRFVRERDPRTGKSQLPWIEHVFYERGTRLTNFYVRGISLSGPSWSLIETGQHLQIKGNAEFDRYTLHAYDYLNLLPLFVKGASGAQVDMVGVEVLDSLGVPLLVDAYPYQERYTGFSIYQRGPRFLTFPNALQNRFKRAPKELFDEWTMGLELRSIIADELIRELIVRLRDPNIHYLDLMLQDFDHMAHQNRDRDSQLQVLKELDAVIGEVWTAIQTTPGADETALLIVSDHGINTDEHVYSQGFNLIKLLGSPAGGGHHVATKRRLLLDYSIRGLNPFYYFISTNSRDSYYLKGQSEDYPTAMLDFDGNERASVHLRDSDLNLLHLILQQLRRKDLADPLRPALVEAFFSTLERRRSQWQATLDELKEELGALHRRVEKQTELWNQQPKKFTKEDVSTGHGNEVRRIFSQLRRWEGQERDYSEYARILDSLLAQRRDNFDALKLRIEDVIPRHAMGEQNSIYELQNYVVGVSPTGLALNADGSLDLQKSFSRINYFSLLQGITVRNNVQRGVSDHPVEFVATRIPSDLIGSATDVDRDQVKGDAVWLYGGPDQQAIILAREDSEGQLSFLYRPVRNLEQDATGRIHFEPAPWQPGLPLEIIEDPALAIPVGKPQEWLSQWHTDVEWLHALHRTQHSNGVIGLYEELGHHPVASDTKNLTPDELLMRRFVQRQRRLIEADLLVLANNHWNFDVRGFNPGGNHGSFLRISTHSTWMLAGGEHTGIPRGFVIDEPYDSLSFLPTVLALTGKLGDDRTPQPVLWEKGFRRFPGRVVKEVIGKAVSSNSNQQSVISNQ
jgi:hypothetical protein